MAKISAEDITLVEEPKQEITTTDYLAQKALRGVSSPVGAAAGYGMGFAKGATGWAEGLGLNQPEYSQTDVTEAANKVRSVIGIKPEMKAPGFTSSVLGSAIEAATDPYSYLIPAGGLLRSAVTPPLYGAYAEVGGQVGENLAGQGGRTVGALVSTVLNPNLIVEAGLGQINLNKDILNSFNEMSKQFGNRKAALMIASAYSSDPQLKSKLARAAELEATTGVKIPLLSAADDNNVLTQTARSMAAKDLDFGAAYSKLEQQATEQLKGRQSRLFGSAADELFAQYIGKPVQVSKPVEKRIRSVDEQLADLGLQFEKSETQDIGNKLRNLVTAKETQVRKELTTKYDNVIQAADKAGYKVSNEETANLYGFVNNELNQDIFKKFPQLYGSILTNFKPKTVQASTLLDEAGQPIVAASKEFPEASMKDLDSLKRATNLALSKASSENIPTLIDLKRQINQVIDNMPGDIGNSYKAVDKEFATRVGIPYGAKTVEDVKYKDFVEQAIPAITKNKTALADYLASVDKDSATNVVKEAFFADATRYGVVKDGVLDPKRLSRYIETHKDQLALVPEVKDALTNMKVDGLELVATRNRLDKMRLVQDTQDSAKIFNRFNQAGVDGVAGDFIGSPKFRDQFMNSAGKNDQALRVLRAKMTENALNAPDPLVYIKENSSAFDRAFGKTYSKQLNDLAEVATRLDNNNLFVNIPLKTIKKTGMEELTGISPAGAVSLIRDRISSVAYKGVNVLSKFYVNQADKAERQSLGQFFADPESVRKVHDTLNKIDNLNITGEVSDRTTQLLKDLSSSMATSMVRRGVVGTEVGTQESPRQKQTYELRPEDIQVIGQ